MEASNHYEVAEIELVYKPGTLLKDRPVITGSKDANEIFLSTWDMDRICLNEQFKVLFLNHANRVLGLYVASTGGTKATVVDIRLVMVAALKINASAIILAHNHPSGLLVPSKQDIALTEQMIGAAKLLDIRIFDHIIVTNNGCYSFADKGDI